MPDLICVDPKRIHEVWPIAEPLLREAITRYGISAWQDIESDILYGNSLLWMAGEELALSTALQDTDAGRVCVLTALGGTNLFHWLPLISTIEQYAKNEGCICVRIFGRKGWLRVLKDYKMTGIILDKVI